MRAQSLRAFVQGLFLGLFVLLFALTVFPLRSPIPVDLLLRLNPLATAISFLASRTVVSRMLLSLVLLGATFFVGRFFCGYVCPMGTVIDLADRPLCSIKFARFKVRAVPRFPKYYLLGFLLFMSLFGRSVLWPLDPLVIFARSLTVFLHPVGIFLVNSGLDIVRPLADRWGIYTLADADFYQPAYASWAFPLIAFLVILGLGLLGRRFWCRAFCPLGALLALVAGLSPMKRMVRSDLCSHCHLCRKSCPMAAVEEDELKTAHGECCKCRICTDVCPQRAVSFHVGGTDRRTRVDWDRRQLVLVSLLGIAAFSLSRIVPRTSSAYPGRIRPPGAIPEALFLTRCLRCGECMKVCLTNGLQPATDEVGFMGLWTPVLVPRKGPCERHCNMCGQVCPTQAIRSLSLEEKSYASIGRANVNRSRCLEWGYGKACLVCDEVCPYGAIFVGKSPEKGRRGPVVDPKLCVGCGVCEQHCPVPGQAAIQVSSQGEERRLKGSYITAEKVRARRNIESGDKGFI